MLLSLWVKSGFYKRNDMLPQVMIW